MVEAQQQFLLVQLLKHHLVSRLAHPLRKFQLHRAYPLSMISHVLNEQFVTDVGLQQDISDMHRYKFALAVVYTSYQVSRVGLSYEGEHLANVE